MGKIAGKPEGDNKDLVPFKSPYIKINPYMYNKKKRKRLIIEEKKANDINYDEDANDSSSDDSSNES